MLRALLSTVEQIPVAIQIPSINRAEHTPLLPYRWLPDRRHPFSILVALCLFAALSACGGTEQSASQPKDLSDAEPTYFGIDVSRYEGRLIDQLTPEDSGLKFIICKATEGESLVDSEFAYNWAQIKKKGFIRGAYHFYYFNDSVQKQLQAFAKNLVLLEADDLPPIVDVEDHSLKKSTASTPAELQASLLSFLQAVESHYQRTPMLYVGYAFANEHLDNPAFTKYPLWVADYRGEQAQEPKVPNPWKDVGWKIWQKSENHELKVRLPTGEKAFEKLDYDEYRGKLADLVKS